MKLHVFIGETGRDCQVKTESGEDVEGANGIEVLSTVSGVTRVRIDFIAPRIKISFKERKDEKDEQD